MKLFSGITSDLDINKLQFKLISTQSLHGLKWLLKLNAQKCKTITVGESHNGQTHTYQLDSQNLCTVTEEKHLGVLIDNDLQFENHILSKNQDSKLDYWICQMQF